jgi:hypothetical protein
MKCDNYNEDSEECSYFEALQGSGEDLPTGCDEVSGKCKALDDNYQNWYEVENEDCDMVNFE